jgi:hypothetical protein
MFSIMINLGAGRARSVQRLATGFMAERTEFEYLQGQELSLLHVV